MMWLCNLPHNERPYIEAAAVLSGLRVTAGEAKKVPGYDPSIQFGVYTTVPDSIALDAFWREWRRQRGSDA